MNCSIEETTNRRLSAKMTTPFVCKVHTCNSENASTTPTQTTNHSKCYDLFGQRRTNLFQMTSIILILLNLPYMVYGIYLQPDFKEKSCWTGERFFVTCLREKGESEGQVIWIDPHRREVNENTGSVRVYTANSDAGGTSMMFEDVKKKDGGEYVCQYKKNDREPAKQVSFKLNVYKAINFQGNKGEVVAVQGDAPFTISCLARFDPSATFSQITWFYNNAPLSVNDEGGQFTESNHQSANLDQVTIKSTLTIRGVKKDNEGNYTCRAFTSNAHLSRMEQFPIHLRVQYPPTFTPNMPTEIWIDLEKRKDDLVNITCTVQADPPARFQWYSVDGIPIGDGRFRNQVVNVSEQDNMSVLTVRYHHNPTHKNERPRMNQITQFRCKAQNHFGEREASFQIKTGSMPVSPTVFEHKYGKGLLTLVLQEPTIEPPIDLYRVEIENRLYVDFNATNENPGNNNTYTIPIDIPRGEHMMTVYAHNPVGWSSNLPGLPPQKLAVVSASTHLQSYLAVIFALILGLSVFYN